MENIDESPDLCVCQPLSHTHRWYRRCSTSTYVNMPRAQSCDIIVKIYVRAISKTHRRRLTHWKKSLWETECNRAEERKPVTATDTNRSFGKWLRLCEGDKSSYGQLWHKDTLLTNRICVVHFPILIALRIFRTHFMGFFIFHLTFAAGELSICPDGDCADAIDEHRGMQYASWTPKRNLSGLIPRSDNIFRSAISNNKKRHFIVCVTRSHSEVWSHRAIGNVMLTHHTEQTEKKNKNGKRLRIEKVDVVPFALHAECNSEEIERKGFTPAQHPERSARFPLISTRTIAQSHSRTYVTHACRRPITRRSHGRNCISF